MTTTTSPTLDLVRRIVGRRAKIARHEMRDILALLGQQGLDLRNPYVASTIDHSRGDGPQSPTAADAWARACCDITVISVDARGGLRDGYVRYDQPGSMHPLQHAELMFVSETLGRYEYDQIGQMRRHADRVLIVRDEPEPASEAAEAPTVCQCDNGHRWQTVDPDRDVHCPECGECWV